MKTLKLMSLAIAFFLTSCTSMKTFYSNLGGNNLSASKIHLVDQQGNNYLFRGNNPMTGSGGTREFDYDDLVADFNSSLAAANKSALPSNFYLVDISLLNATEYFDLHKEMTYFENNPDKGKLINWPLLGVDTLIPVDKITERYLSDSTFIKDNNLTLNKWITDLNKLMKTPSEQVKVYYVHCNEGCDRTGEFIGAYRMTLKDVTYSDALELNTSECGRAPNFFSSNGTKWYCNYLQSTDKIKYKSTCNF